jgi:NAD(P)-dependent dehydrogenase (short-subunit alcohol dehydrogenase family)
MSEVAVVTGGSGGIGLAIMSALRATGATVISLDLTPPSTGEWIECDVRDRCVIAHVALNPLAGRRRCEVEADDRRAGCAKRGHDGHADAA